MEIEVWPSDDEGGILFENPRFSFEPGVTFLVGCNGSGKTTLMRQVDEKFRFGSVDGVVSRVFDCTMTSDEIGRLIALDGRHEAVSIAATMMSSSEGERMAQALTRAFGWMWNQSRRDDVSAIWMMLDSLDSGLDKPPD